jgi:hypothetical protein
VSVFRCLPLVAAFVLATPAAAALEPSRLVLGPADVPAGFTLDPTESGLRTNARETKEFPAAREYYRRWKRVTGYQALYRKGASKLEARADVFRSRSGAGAMLDLADREWRKAGISGQTRAPFDLGDRGVVYSASGDRTLTLVLWREGRVFAGLQGVGLPRAQTVALARAMQRGIAGAVG